MKNHPANERTCGIVVGRKIAACDWPPAWGFIAQYHATGTLHSGILYLCNHNYNTLITRLMLSGSGCSSGKVVPSIETPNYEAFLSSIGNHV